MFRGGQLVRWPGNGEGYNCPGVPMGVRKGKSGGGEGPHKIRVWCPGAVCRCCQGPGQPQKGPPCVFSPQDWSYVPLATQTLGRWPVTTRL